MARLSFRATDELLAAVDAERGLIPRETWLRTVVERALDSGAHGNNRGINPDLDIRGSAQVKRGVRPIPKRGK